MVARSEYALLPAFRQILDLVDEPARALDQFVLLANALVLECRAVEKGESQGFMKVTVDAKTKEILGAAILGVGGDEAIHCILDVMYSKQPYTTLQRAMHIHPTVSEFIPTMLGDLQPLS